MKESTSDRIRRMHDRLEMEKLKYYAAVRKAYPVGRSVGWQKNSAHPPQSGRVVRHGYEDRLHVENVRTGKTVCITHYDIHCAHQYFATRRPAAPLAPSAFADTQEGKL